MAYWVTRARGDEVLAEETSIAAAEARMLELMDAEPGVLFHLHEVTGGFDAGGFRKLKADKREVADG